MSTVIVPNYVRDAINARLDAALVDAPAEAKADREHLYGVILAYFDEHGELPEITIKPVAVRDRRCDSLTPEDRK